MALSRFFMTREDCAELISFLIEQFSAEFMPNRSDFPPPFPRYRTLAEIQARIDEDRHLSRFQVLSPQWEQFPLHIDEVHANNGQHFYSASLQGGPFFDLIVSRTSQDGNIRWVITSSFGDYSLYVVSFTPYQAVERPVTMEAAHRAVRNYLRRKGCQSICRERGHTGPWILPGALQEFSQGLWLRSGDWHYEPKSKAGKTPRTKHST